MQKWVCIAYPKIFLPENVDKLLSLLNIDIDKVANSHTAGDNISPFTSWTEYRYKAEEFSEGKSRTAEGVILTKQFKKSRLIQSETSKLPYFEDEGEYLVPGIVHGANVDSNKNVEKKDE